MAGNEDQRSAFEPSSEESTFSGYWKLIKNTFNEFTVSLREAGKEDADMVDRMVNGASDVHVPSDDDHDQRLG